MLKSRAVSAVIMIVITALVLFAGSTMTGKGMAAELADGTYEGLSDAGMHPGLIAQVVVAGGRIVEVKVISHGETPGISDPAIAEIPVNIIAAQSTEIDSVSGATMTSTAIKEAVANALASQPGVKVPVAYADGTYFGTSDAGMNAGLKVQVEVKDGKIVSVEVIEHDETPGMSDPAIAGIPGAIVAAGSPDVDVVSGATFTSEGIIDAVKKALEAGPGGAEEPTEEPAEEIIPADRVYVDGIYEGSSDAGMHAGLKVSVEIVGGKIASVEVIAHEETEGISDPAISGVPEAIVAANTPSVDGVSGATYTSMAIKEAVKLALENAVAPTVYKDGVYEGSSDAGMHAGLKVSVQVVDGKIASVEVIAHEETDGISDPAISGVPQAIVDANSTEVDAVSGATYTSTAIIEATALALENAK
jgi:uncharacterized protein with FMN-binding domain